MRPIAFLALLPLSIAAQDQLPKHRNFKKWQDAKAEIAKLSSQFATRNYISYSPDSKIVIMPGGKGFDLSSKAVIDYKPTSENSSVRRGVERGRQFTVAVSPDKTKTAKYDNGNIYLEIGNSKFPVTKDGDLSKRIKYGTGSWVYGEELGQNEAMWWSPDSRKLVYYRFDESQVKDYHVTLDQGKIQNVLYSEAYPKAGTPNPKVKLYVYDTKADATAEINTDFKSDFPISNELISEYIYQVRFAPDGRHLLFNRTNRKQNVLEICSANLDNGSVKVIFTDHNPNGWVDNTPQMQFLSDEQSFLVLSERTGFWNIMLGSLSGAPTQSITDHKFEVESILKIDEARKEIWYTAHSSGNPYLVQLHRINWETKKDTVLTDASKSHQVVIAPDFNSFIDTSESLTYPRQTSVRDRDGKLIVEGPIANPFENSRFKSAIPFSCLAADGKTPIYGYYRVPSDFNPRKRYPVILRVYGGPDSGSGRERFVGADPDCELGFITAWVDGRGTKGRGRDFRMAPYRKLGVVEIDDQAAAMKYFQTLKFVDAKKIGIEGTSYGGYASIMALLRYPDVFSVAVASSSVTAWEHYDTIYTERFMDTPQNNPEGYKAGSAMNYAKDLKGKLCLFYGTADDNVHPSNTHQLIQALDKNGKPYRLYVGVDQGHAGLRQDRELEFFLEAFK